MRILLDTHAFLWSIGDPAQLTSIARTHYLNTENELFLSAASYWEICIKHALGKLRLAENWSEIFEREMAGNGIQWLPIEKEHCLGLLKLPFIHRDPFDRLLLAQANVERLSILTADTNMKRYDVKTIW